MLVFRRAAIIAAHLFLLVASSVTAQDISLLSHDKAIRLDGTFLGFDGRYYRIDTTYGELTVDGSGVLCEGPACPNLTDYVAELTVAGSQQIAQGLWLALLTGFAERNGWILTQESDAITLTESDTQRAVAVFHMSASTTDAGFAALLNGAADMVLASRPVTRQERALAKSAGFGDLVLGRQAMVIGLDAVIPIAAPSLPVSRLSLGQIRAIVSGTITDWSQVDGPEAVITLHLPSLQTGFGQTIAAQFGVDLTKTKARPVFHDSAEALADAVANDPFALGLTALTGANGANHLAIQGSCGFALRPDAKSVKAEDYPLNAPLILYRPARRLPKVGRDLVAYLASDEAQSVVRAAGYIDQAPEAYGLDAQGDRLMNAIRHAGTEVSLADLKAVVDELQPRQRLTTSFRFEAGSSQLDAQSRSNVELLAAALLRGDYDGQNLLFVGFSDGQGAAGANKALSQERAAVVLEAVLAAAEGGAGQATLGTVGYGEAMPMACDDSDWGRDANRRVEVWVKPAIGLTDTPRIGN
ncbi:OmpA family protein [Donghicola sp. C2-DW-16]|uniref:OmpA family protein n=1 Tax=Donghicola mangrovi TaxID=2729614 RepID=A0ABX2PAP8_9RHOB|nr:phosphate ABC transporter substrate-binding/OmpA family protein [Donghicola mangrovi]NVO26176.1 OmpA family protein [Donghicola mangrovi]